MSRRSVNPWKIITVIFFVTSILLVAIVLRTNHNASVWQERIDKTNQITQDWQNQIDVLTVKNEAQRDRIKTLAADVAKIQDGYMVAASDLEFVEQLDKNLDACLDDLQANSPESDVSCRQAMEEMAKLRSYMERNANKSDLS